MRRTKVAQIDRKTGHLRAVKPLFGQTTMDSPVRCPAIDSEDAMTLSLTPVTAASREVPAERRRETAKSGSEGSVPERVTLPVRHSARQWCSRGH